MSAECNKCGDELYHGGMCPACRIEELEKFCGKLWKKWKKKGSLGYSDDERRQLKKLMAEDKRRDVYKLLE